MKIWINAFIVPLLSISYCSNNGISQSENSTKMTTSQISESIKTEPNQGRRGAFRTVEGNKIIRTFDASQLPFTIGEEITDEDQQFIILIKNVTKPTISAKINTIEKGRNLRINQVILPDGSSDGPFSKEMKLVSKKNGNYKIVIGKNLMAEGKLSGNISVTVK